MESYKRIQYLIDELGLNISSFSKKIGLSNNVTIGRIINEKRNPSYDTMVAIIETFNVNPDWLFTGKGEIFRTDIREQLKKIQTSINQLIIKIDNIHK